MWSVIDENYIGVSSVNWIDIFDKSNESKKKFNAIYITKDVFNNSVFTSIFTSIYEKKITDKLYICYKNISLQLQSSLSKYFSNNNETKWVRNNNTCNCNITNIKHCFDIFNLWIRKDNISIIAP